MSLELKPIDTARNSWPFWAPPAPPRHSVRARWPPIRPPAAPTCIGLEEVVVTAQRKSENLQDVPITVQATSAAQLQQLNITTVNELLKYTPNVTFSSNGPGMGNIFMRGLSYGGAPGQSQATIAPMPNVALYLDDQSMAFPGHNNDVYLVDMERVEILEGPQGTLFGGGSQAGLVRYITNKPKLNRTEGNVNASYGTTSGGDPNSSANATINLPIIAGQDGRCAEPSLPTLAAVISITRSARSRFPPPPLRCRMPPARSPTTQA